MEVVVAGGLALSSLIYRTTVDYRQNKKVLKDIVNKWDFLMVSLTNSKSQTQTCQRYELLEVFIKHYGFDGIVSIPQGKSFNELKKLTTVIETSYGAECMLELSENRNTAYLRVHYSDYEISEKDSIKFKWFKTFFGIEKCSNAYGESFKITEIEDIYSPLKEVVGYKIKCKIPLGLNYSTLKDTDEIISKTLGKCYVNFDHKGMVAEVSIINKPIDDKTPFALIPVKAWELYVCMGYDYEPIMLDYSISANALIGGKVGSGKTVSEIMAFINLCCQCDDFELYIGMIGEKQDLRIFRDSKQCKYYAQSERDLLALLRYLNKEMDRRNRLFANRKELVFNIFKYNSVVKKEDKLPVIHLLSDEIADFMDCSQKEEVQKLTWSLIRKGRSSGIFCTFATQRGSLENLSGEIKANLSNKISFNMANTASALTILSGDNLAKRVVGLEKSREALIDYTEGVKIGKTLFLNEDMMEKFMKDVIVKNKKHLNIDITGNINTETSEKDNKTNKNEPKTLENSEKNQVIDKNTDKSSEKPKSRFEEYQKQRKEKKDKELQKRKELEDIKRKIDDNSL